MNVPFRFGHAVDVDYTPKNSGSWFDVPDGRVWKLDIYSEGAYSINLIIEGLRLSEDAKLYIYNASRTMVYGPLTVDNTGKTSSLGTDLVQGDLITIELFEPANSKNRSEWKIAKIIHGYKNILPIPNNFGDAMSCHNNVVCPAFSSWSNHSNSVAMVLLADGTRHCSGALLNNTCGDFTPNFLTAFHCIDVGNNINSCEEEFGNGTLNGNEINRAQNWVFRFQYKSPTCSPSTEPLTWVTYNGATYRAGLFDSDFALVELNTRPNANSGVRYAGWSKSTSAPTSGANIHHPRGDVMKISTYGTTATSSAAITWNIGCSRTNTTPASSHWTVPLTSGTTERGSSGSPLFDQNGRVVGQLHGGLNGCAPVNKHYGKFDLSWGADAAGNFLPGRNAANSLATWLDPDNLGSTTTDMLAIPSITGPSTLCSTGTYILINASAGSATWNVSLPSGVTPTFGTGNVANLTMVNGEDVTLTFTYIHGCGDTMTVAKQIIVGPPMFSHFLVDGIQTTSGTMCVNNSVSIEAVPNDPSASYYWTCSSPNGSIMNATARSTYFYAYSADCFDLDLAISNSCGTNYKTLQICAYNCFHRYTVYPNPAKDLITIEFEEIANVSGLPDEIQLLSDKSTRALKTINVQEVFTKKAFQNGNQIQIEVPEFPRGIYYLHIKNSRRKDKELDIVRVIIE